MNIQQKQSVKEAIINLKEIGKSQEAIAKQADISSANISQILKDNWEKISDKLWHKIASNLGVSFGQWQTAEISNYKEIMGICLFAQERSAAKLISFDAGFGKSHALLTYSKENANVFYLQCERHFTRKVFLQKLGTALGLELSGIVTEMVDKISDRLKQTHKPLLILDEFDKVLDKSGVFDLFKTFYDTTLNHCGFVLCGAISLEQELIKRVQRNKIGYTELFSRIGRKCINLRKLTKKDIELVCYANQITDKEAIHHIALELSGGDLRQLKALIEEYNLSQTLN